MNENVHKFFFLKEYIFKIDFLICKLENLI